MKKTESMPETEPMQIDEDSKLAVKKAYVSPKLLAYGNISSVTGSNMGSYPGDMNSMMEDPH